MRDFAFADILAQIYLFVNGFAQKSTAEFSAVLFCLYYLHYFSVLSLKILYTSAPPLCAVTRISPSTM